MTGPRRAPAPPLRLRLRSGTAARHTISYQSKERNPTAGGATSSVRAGPSASGRNDLPSRPAIEPVAYRPSRATEFAPVWRSSLFRLDVWALGFDFLIKLGGVEFRHFLDGRVRPPA
jgi:hypothetical protein